MERIKFGLLGAGGFAREVMPFLKGSISEQLGISEESIDIYFVETWQPKTRTVNGYPLISADEFKLLDGQKYFNVAVGSGRDRESMAVSVSSFAEPLSLFASEFTCYDENQIAKGAVFCANTIVTSNVKIGSFFQCNLDSYVAHDCEIGDFVTFAPAVRCNGRVHIGDYAYIGTGAIIREGTSEKPLRIGKGAVVGMGAVVTKDVPDGAVVIGNPARLMERH